MLSSLDKESEIGGKVALNSIDILTPVQNVISLCNDKANAKNIELVIKGEEALVNINSPLIEQALINLVDNAIKFGPENSHVTVEVIHDKENSKVFIHVTDQGNGIPEEHHDRLFERFYSVNKARSRELGGSGLGLSIVKHIVLAHSGNITVQSEVGKGSTFTIELPNA